MMFYANGDQYLGHKINCIIEGGMLTFTNFRMKRSLEVWAERRTRSSAAQTRRLLRGKFHERFLLRRRKIHLQRWVLKI